MRSETGFSNGLSDAQSERMAILAEECGEVIQIVGKILRHGYHSYNPTVPEMQQKPNVALLQKELGDVIWAICMMDDAADIDFQIPRTNASLNGYIRRKQAKAEQYLHHQPQLAERNERERGQGEDAHKQEHGDHCGCYECCNASTAPREDFPVLAKKPCGCLEDGRPCAKACGMDMTGWTCAKDEKDAKRAQPQAVDVIAQVANIIRTKFHENPATSYNEIATEVSQVIVRALQEEMKRVANTKSECLVSADECYRKAARNLGLEVRG